MAPVYRPRVGDIGLCGISGWGGGGIRTAQHLMGCGWKIKQHAFVVTENDPAGDSGPWIVEAMPDGARHVLNWHTDVHWLVCPNTKRAAVAQAALDLVGTPYSWLDYEAIALHHLHLPSGWIKDYIASTKHMICSQLADEAALRGGWHLFDDGRWPGYVPPCDLDKLWIKHYALHNGTAY